MVGNDDPEPRPGAAAKHAAARVTVRRIASTRLFDGASEIVIEHAGREYRLRITRNGKLILTA
jgi:hemin uptake protein HemP